MLASSRLDLGPEDSERAVLSDYSERAAHGQHHGCGRNTVRNPLNVYDEASAVARSRIAARVVAIHYVPRCGTFPCYFNGDSPGWAFFYVHAQYYPELFTQG